MSRPRQSSSNRRAAGRALRAVSVAVAVATVASTLATHAGAQGSDSGMEPFRAFSWADDTARGSTTPARITTLVGVNLFSPGESINAGWAWAANGDPVRAARALADREPGRRVLFVYGAERFNDQGLTNLFHQPLDRIVDPVSGQHASGIWPTKGTSRARAVYDDYFSRLKTAIDDRLPGQSAVNGLVLDMETTLSNWSMMPAAAPRPQRDPYPPQGNRWRAVEADPRYDALQKTLAARHSAFGSTRPLEHVADFLDIPGTNAGEPYLFWNSAMKGRVAAALNEAVYDPFRQRFPGVTTSNYESARLSYPNVADPLRPPTSVPLIPDANGHLEFFDPIDGPMFGNTAAPTLYGWVSPNIVNSRPEYTVITGSVASNPLLTAFGQVVVAANMVRGHVRATLAATEEANITPWIAPKSWSGEGGLVIPWAGTDYYDEMIYQAALASGKTNFIYWNTVGKGRNALGNLVDPALLSPDDVALSGILDDLSVQFAGQVPFRPLLLDHVDYADEYLVGAVEFADGRIVGRVTFSATDRVASFKLGGETFTIAAAGSIGHWFTTSPISPAFVVTPVPEPSAIALFGAAAACGGGLAIRRRRSRRTTARGRADAATAAHSMD